MDHQEIQYSFIIPHKNNPKLLRRCIDSIPKRKDIQIIVVDDNSDEGKKPFVEREEVEVILLDVKQSKGAGRARNVGLEHARGKWLLFADADDYYTDGFLDVLDSVSSDGLDVIYFNARRLGVDGKEKEGGSRINGIIEGYNGSPDSLDMVKYRIHVPWNKLVRRAYVNSYGFMFEEVPRGNDTMFTYQVGYFTDNVKIITDKLYVYTVNSDSITHKKINAETCLISLINIKKNIAFNKYVGHKEWNEEINVSSSILGLIRRMRVQEAFQMFWVYLKKRDIILRSENIYIDLIESKKVKI